jgi:hypothetical protein
MSTAKAEQSLNTTELEQKVKDMYREVAQHPARITVSKVFPCWQSSHKHP